MPDRPDHPLEARLDDRIRDLVGRAVASAPQPPQIDTSVVAVAGHDGGRPGRWWLAAAGVALIAVVAGAVVLTRDGDETVGPTQSDPTSTPTPDPMEQVQPLISVVTNHGVSVRDARNGEEVATLDDGSPLLGEITHAVALGDGRVAVGDDSDWAIWDTDTDELSDPFAEALLAGPLRLHDVAIINGVPTILFSIQPDEGEAILRVYRANEQAAPDDGGEVGGGGDGGGGGDDTPEAIVAEIPPSVAAGRLSLGANGLIAGVDPSRGEWIELYALPGSRAEEELGGRTAADLGLPQQQVDCEPTCTITAALSPDGEQVAWYQPGGVRTAVVRVISETIGEVDVDASGGIDLLPDDSLLVTGGPGTTPSRVVRVSGDDEVVADTVEEFPGATSVTYGPSWTHDSFAHPPEQPILPLLVAVTEDGIAARDPLTGGDVATISADRAWINANPSEPAVAAGDGRVVFGDNVWDTNSGATEGFLGPAEDLVGPARVHDVAIIDGRPWVLFDVQDWGGTQGEVVGGFVLARPLPLRGELPDTRDQVSVATLTAGEANSLGRMHLASSGLVVGAMPSRGPWTYVAALPGSAADERLSGRTAAELGLPQASYRCADGPACAFAATVSDDGERVAILRGRELAVRDLWSAEVTETYVDVGVSADDIDFMPDGTLLVVPSSAEGDLSPRRIEADGTVVEEYPDSMRVSYGPSALDGAVVVEPQTPVTQAPDITDVTSSATDQPATTPVPETSVEPTVPPTNAPETEPPPTLPPLSTTTIDGGPPHDGRSTIAIVTADGVTIRSRVNGAEGPTFDGPLPGGETVTRAIPVGDGTYVLQGDECCPYLWNPDDGTPPTTMYPERPSDTNFRVHDVATIRGEPFVVLSEYVRLDDSQEFAEHLAAGPLDGGHGLLFRMFENVGGMSEFGKEYGVQRLHLADNGALVGEFVNEGNRIGPMVAAVPDTPAARLLDGRTPDELRIPKPIGDCEVCPAAYAVSDDGQTIAWMDGAKLAARSLWDPDAGVTRIETGGGAVDIDVVADGTFLLAMTTEATGVPAPRHVAVDASLITEFPGATFLDS